MSRRIGFRNDFRSNDFGFEKGQKFLIFVSTPDECSCDELVKSQKASVIVIPVKTGIQENQSRLYFCHMVLRG